MTPASADPKSKSGARALCVPEENEMAEQPVFLNNDAVKRFLSYDELIPRLEEVLGKFSRGDSSEMVQPVRSVIPIGNHNGYDKDLHGQNMHHY